jgi:hypothetical protein
VKKFWAHPATSRKMFGTSAEGNNNNNKKFTYHTWSLSNGMRAFPTEQPPTRSKKQKKQRCGGIKGAKQNQV